MTDDLKQAEELATWFQTQANFHCHVLQLQTYYAQQAALIRRLIAELEQAQIEIANRTFLERDASKRAESAEAKVKELESALQKGKT